ncbi:MAG: molecular chaperone HtpG [Myxococcales bacterium]|nr:molecular chaperone HtpG [Polyangiaceae bacterium]MDW8248322.1 molecular chaperone HtpG [Myxococcales bacterium]
MSETHKFQAEVSQLLKLVINSLYSNKEIFLRELISNASDAIDRLRFRSIREPELIGDGTPFEIRLLPDPKAGTLTIEDTGVGMTHDELIQNLGTIAHSGTRAFLERIQSGEKPNLIGQFGVGFYSAYLVADRVDVISRAAGETKAFRWSSDARESFTIEEAQRVERGTSVVLHLRAEHRKFLDDWELRDLVRRYSDYVSHPIKLRVSTGEQSGKFEVINKASALWQRPPKEVTQAQYDEFYRHLTHDFEGPLTQTHFQVEGTLLFSGILFLPKKAPFDLFHAQGRRGIHLFVKRVFILEDCDELLPPWLRFVRGVIDSDDLPLNVSREMLQDSSIIRTIRKQVIKKTLDLLEDLAKEQPGSYATFWDQFGAVLKEGIATDGEYRDRIAELARFASTHGTELTSLADYVSRMPEGQKDIYYAIGDSKESVASSPYLEALRKRGYEVLLLSDPIDEWAVDALRSYKDKKLVSAMRTDLKLDEQSNEEKKKQEGAVAPLCDRIKTFLKDKVVDVRPSERLTDSPVCLVIPQGAHHAPMEQLLRASGRNLGATRRILEVNPTHPLIQSLQRLNEQEPSSEKLREWVETLYDQAVLMEGGRIEDPNRFARRVTHLLQEVAAGVGR